MARCKHLNCKRKIPSIIKELSRCRCGKLYCHEHRLAHDCTFDYQSHHKKTLEKQLTKVEPKKVIKV